MRLTAAEEIEEEREEGDEASLGPSIAAVLHIIHWDIACRS